MRVPQEIKHLFDDSYVQSLAQVLSEEKWIERPEDLESRRFLRRAITPHIERLSTTFNRLEDDSDHQKTLEHYWKKGSNPKNLRLAYFLVYAHANFYRWMSIWSELARYGYQWPQSAPPIRGLDLGSGPGCAALAAQLAAHQWPELSISKSQWTCVEQDRPMSQLAQAWLRCLPQSIGKSSLKFETKKMQARPSKWNLSQTGIGLWTSSYFLNELDWRPKKSSDDGSFAKELIEHWNQTLADHALIIIVEPALQAQSRRLLSLRKDFIQEFKNQDQANYQILLPCLDNRNCGALESSDDWCHEDVRWRQPKFIQMIDQLTGLHHGSLPFSYLVIQKSPDAKSAPGLSIPSGCSRLVSPVHRVRTDAEFFLCQPEAKTRVRCKFQWAKSEKIERGTVLGDLQLEDKKKEATPFYMLKSDPTPLG